MPASHSEPRQTAREARPSQRAASKVRRTLDEAQPATQALSSASDEPRKSRRSERRLSSDSNQVVRRWTEYTYDTPGGGQKRVIVIQRGSVNDNFFQAMR